MSDFFVGIDWGAPRGEANVAIVGKVVGEVTEPDGKTKPMIMIVDQREIRSSRAWHEEALDERATRRWPPFLQRFARRERRRMSEAWRRMGVAYDKGAGRDRRRR